MAKTVRNNREAFIRDSEESIRGTDDDTLKLIKADADRIILHNESGERALGSTAGSSPGLLTSITPWVIVTSATANEYGVVKEVFNGAEDYDLPFTPTKIHPHAVMIVTNNSDGKLWKFQFANSSYNGSTHDYADMAAAIAAVKYTTAIVKFETRKSTTTALDFRGGRMTKGSKLWCRCLNDEASATTISILMKAHGYLV